MHIFKFYRHVSVQNQSFLLLLKCRRSNRLFFHRFEHVLFAQTGTVLSLIDIWQEAGLRFGVVRSESFGGSPSTFRLYHSKELDMHIFKFHRHVFRQLLLSKKFISPSLPQIYILSRHHHLSFGYSTNKKRRTSAF